MTFGSTRLMTGGLAALLAVTMTACGGSDETAEPAAAGKFTDE